MRQATLTVNYIILALMVSAGLSLIGIDSLYTRQTLQGFALVSAGNIVSIIYAHKMANK